jgi:hypothetical protein
MSTGRKAGSAPTIGLDQVYELALAPRTLSILFRLLQKA